MGDDGEVDAKVEAKVKGRMHRTQQQPPSAASAASCAGACRVVRGETGRWRGTRRCGCGQGSLSQS